MPIQSNDAILGIGFEFDEQAFNQKLNKFLSGIGINVEKSEKSFTGLQKRNIVDLEVIRRAELTNTSVLQATLAKKHIEEQRALAKKQYDEQVTSTLSIGALRAKWLKENNDLDKRQTAETDSLTKANLASSYSEAMTNSKKLHDSQVKANQKLAEEEIKNSEKIKKHKEEVDTYLLNVRKRSIALANSANEKAEKEKSSSGAKAPSLESISAKRLQAELAASKLNFENLEHQYVAHSKRVVDLKEQLSLTENRIEREKIQKEIAEEQRATAILRKEYQSREEVAHKGGGAEHDILGVGRELVSSIGIGQVASVAGAGILLKQLEHEISEAGAHLEEFKRQSFAAFETARVPAAKIGSEVQRNIKFTNEWADRLGVPLEKMRQGSIQAATLGGAYGKTNEEVVKMAISVEKQTKGLIGQELVIKALTRGLSDPGAKDAVGRLSSQFPLLATAVSGAKNQTDFLNRAMKVLQPTIKAAEESTGDLAEREAIAANKREKALAQYGLVWNKIKGNVLTEATALGLGIINIFGGAETSIDNLTEATHNYQSAISHQEAQQKQTESIKKLASEYDATKEKGGDLTDITKKLDEATGGAASTIDVYGHALFVNTDLARKFADENQKIADQMAGIAHDVMQGEASKALVKLGENFSKIKDIQGEISKGVPQATAKGLMAGIVLGSDTEEQALNRLDKSQREYIKKTQIEWDNHYLSLRGKLGELKKIEAEGLDAISKSIMENTRNGWRTGIEYSFEQAKRDFVVGSENLNTFIAAWNLGQANLKNPVVEKTELGLPPINPSGGEDRMKKAFEKRKQAIEDAMNKEKTDTEKMLIEQNKSKEEIEIASLKIDIKFQAQIAEAARKYGQYAGTFELQSIRDRLRIREIGLEEQKKLDEKEQHNWDLHFQFQLASANEFNKQRLELIEKFNKDAANETSQGIDLLWEMFKTKYAEIAQKEDLDRSKKAYDVQKKLLDIQAQGIDLRIKYTQDDAQKQLILESLRYKKQIELQQASYKEQLKEAELNKTDVRAIEAANIVAVQTLNLDHAERLKKITDDSTKEIKDIFTNAASNAYSAWQTEFFKPLDDEVAKTKDIFGGLGVDIGKGLFKFGENKLIKGIGKSLGLDDKPDTTAALENLDTINITTATINVKETSKGKDFDQNFNTLLGPDQEQAFQKWKSKYAPNDSGGDYDLRGAFKEGMTPDPQNGHWSDKYKKPNHPTFSNESQYAPYGTPGHWEGEKFIPADTPIDKRSALNGGSSQDIGGVLGLPKPYAPGKFNQDLFPRHDINGIPLNGDTGLHVVGPPVFTSDGTTATKEQQEENRRILEDEKRKKLLKYAEEHPIDQGEISQAKEKGTINDQLRFTDPHFYHKAFQEGMTTVEMGSMLTGGIGVANAGKVGLKHLGMEGMKEGGMQLAKSFAEVIESGEGLDIGKTFGKGLLSFVPGGGFLSSILGFAGGGDVPGTDTGRDTRLIKVRPKERILTPVQARDYDRIMDSMQRTSASYDLHANARQSSQSGGSQMGNTPLMQELIQSNHAIGAVLDSQVLEASGGSLRKLNKQTYADIIGKKFR